MDARYDPASQEQPIFARWEATGVFAGRPEPGGEPFVIALPPPNITGELHMGHALNGSIQDTLIRLRRMQGRDTLWICGTDHASIAVHAVIEKQLRAEGTTRFDLGRERFLERVWEWRAATGATIIQQFKRLGCTLDYEHERFTMDDGYVRAVLEMFVRLYRKGYIYRDNRLINWCPTCASTISDLEVRYEHAVDTLFEVRYRIKGTDDFLTVATVRPETILADTAVAVHPSDERYRHLVGRTAIVPLVDREVPIIADEYVKMDFGTGALKVTPGHDPNDFEIGRRHGLPELSAIGYDGRMTALAGEFAGLPAEAARGQVRDALFAQGLLGKEEPYEHEVGHCDRTGDRIEPLISLQWFMQMEELAAPANAEVRSGRVRFHPKTQENTYFGWMLNIRPWCVSRQLWWGHQIPVWYCPDGHQTVARDEPDACETCGSAALERDPDVLDTWFSSALWPFATIGWPGDDPRLRRYYPGHVDSTARDIINLWVARMLMMGIEFMGEIPFTDVIIHSTIQAADGRRMSKSLGTGVDPLELVDTYGADATRYGLLKMSSTQDVRFSQGSIAEGAKFANKLWNAARFVITQADLTVPAAPAGAEPADRWVRSRLAATIAERGGPHRPVRVLGCGEDALRVRVRVLRLVHRGGQAPPAGRRRRGAARRVGQPAVDARADPAPDAPGVPVRDRGGVVAPARRARPADARAVPGGGRRTPRPGGRGRCAGRDRGRLAGPLDARRAPRPAPRLRGGGARAGARAAGDRGGRRFGDGLGHRGRGRGSRHRARAARRGDRPRPLRA